MSSRESTRVRFNETGDCVKVGEYMVSVRCEENWWNKWCPRKVKLTVYSDTVGEERYWWGQWFEL